MPAVKKPLKTPKKNRVMTGRKIKHLRGTDRGYYPTGKHPFIKSWQESRGLHAYNQRLFGTNENRIGRIVKEKLKGKKKIDVLDVGSGSARFLASLSRMFGEKVALEGLTLGKPFSRKKLIELRKKKEAERGEKFSLEERNFFEKVVKRSEGQRKRIERHNLKQRIGMIETKKLGKKYDLIFSTETFMHTVNPVQALENTLNHLKTGGEAYINFGGEDILSNTKRRKRLRSQGLDVIPLSNGSYYFKRNTSGKISLQ